MFPFWEPLSLGNVWLVSLTTACVPLCICVVLYVMNALLRLMSE